MCAAYQQHKHEYTPEDTEGREQASALVARYGVQYL